MHACFLTLSYSVLLAGSILWIWALARLAPRFHWKSGFFALVLTAVIFLSMRPGIRVLSDETNHISVSRTFFTDRQPRILGSCLLEYGRLVPIEYRDPARPVLFSFFIHLIHTVRGYDYRNVFILNFLALWAFLWLISAFLWARWGPFAAAGAVFFIAAQPIFTLTATSAGYDLFFAFLFMLSFAALFNWLKKPSDAGFDFMWMTFVLMAQARYESFIYALAAAAVLIGFRAVGWKNIRASLPALLTPVLIVPFICQKFFAVSETLNSIRPGVDVFSLGHFLSQNASFIATQLRADFRLPFAGPLNLAGIAGLVFFGVKAARRWESIRPAVKPFVWASAAAVACLWVLFTGYFWGESRHPASARFYLVPCVVLSLSAAALLRQAAFLPRQALFCFGLAAFLVWHPAAINDTFVRNQGSSSEYRFVSEYLRSLPDQDFVLIADSANRYSIYDFGAIGFGYALRHWDKLIAKKKSGAIGRLLVLQRTGSDGRLIPDLGPRRLETLTSRRFSRSWAVVISEVAG